MKATTEIESDGGNEELLEEVAAVIETASEGDRVLFNDRVMPLTATRVRGPYEGRSGFDWLQMEGPYGGIYQLTHRQNRRHGESVSLERRTGFNDDGFPTYEDLPLSSVELVEHHEFRIGQVFEEADPIVGDEYYHVITGCPDSGCYDAETVGVWVEDGEVKRTTESGFFNSHAKERLFDGGLELVDELDIGYGTGRTHYYDAERDEEIYFSSPHERGVDLRPVEDSGLEVVGWETILFGFEERFTPDVECDAEETDTDECMVTDGGGGVKARSSEAMAAGLEIVHYDRGDGRGVYCPDCGADVTDSKDTHSLPDGLDVDSAFGWRCVICANVFPCGVTGSDAPHYNEKMTGFRATFRDGSEQWIPVPAAQLGGGQA